jgi:hypothetical protein
MRSIAFSIGWQTADSKAARPFTAAHLALKNSLNYANLNYS